MPRLYGVAELFRDGIDAFYPVLRTADIGNLVTICCSDGEYIPMDDAPPMENWLGALTLWDDADEN
jgi:hypothetical protein